MSSSCSSTKICFNSNCKEGLERSRKGWRRRTGEFADLCDRCASAYEEGKFCETFHLSASGWRCCESCGKQIHCGCIVSFHMFVLLDAGGIECITCARKSFILTPNPAWPPPSLFLPLQPERIKDISVKNWSQITKSGPVPWRQAPSLFSTSAQSELLSRTPFEVDIPSGIDRLNPSERLATSSLEKKKVEDLAERLTNGSLKALNLGSAEILKNGNDGIKRDEKSSPFGNVSQQPSFPKKDSPSSHGSLAVTSASLNESNGQQKVSGIHAQRPTLPPPLGKQYCGNSGVDSSSETQIRNGRPRGDARGRNHLLPRYWPRLTDKELQQISGDSNSVITPLFEKMLSASDAGRIGRLVLPKKCAEAYFPPISQPEGLPLKVQDLKGQEWIFQFRFWPNNNSRMYVLEGVTPCIQSMQLQAGDIVTFSRLEPEGKLVMGFRKASNTPASDQVNETVNNVNGVSTHGDVSSRKSKLGEVVPTNHHSKGNSVSHGFSAADMVNMADPASTCSKVDKSGYIAKEVLGAKSAFRIKRKNSTLGLKSKRLKIENEDLIELKITWGQAQGLFRPPPKNAASLVVIEGLEFEEYEDAPIIGRPTIYSADHEGERIQWAQCEDCFKWRKIPADALLPSRWTCSENLWDPERSLCSVAQEITAEQLEELIPTSGRAPPKKMKAAKQDPDPVEAMEGLDTLANLAIQDESESLPSSSSQATTTKHPRHRPGCTCIVCIQPPSGKGPKHKQTCTCNVCLTVKRRFRTLMLRREKKQSEKEAESMRQKLQVQFSEQFPDDEIQLCDNTGNICPNQRIMVDDEDTEADLIGSGSSLLSFKGHFDLNIQPERDEELSPGSDSGGMMRLLQDAPEKYLRQQRLLSSSGNRNSGSDQTQQGGVGAGNFSNGTTLGSRHQDSSEAGHIIPLSAIEAANDE